jgi:hypothetical protein
MGASVQWSLCWDDVDEAVQFEETADWKVGEKRHHKSTAITEGKDERADAADDQLPQGAFVHLS